MHPRPPGYSFGHVTSTVDKLTGRSLAPPSNGPLTADLHSSRTSFITHSIRGGLATPATAGANPIGPTDYYPQYDASLRRAPRHSFAVTSRFGAINTYAATGPGGSGGGGAVPTSATSALSKFNSTPGPKYNFRDLSDRVDNLKKKLSLTWLP
jgi:hypothetical protein